MRNRSRRLGRFGAFVALLLASGCTTMRYIPVETVRDRWHTQTQADTVVVRDSIVIEHNGDTVRETRWRDRWHRSVVHDTIASCDTIREPYPVAVPAQLTAWERVKIGVGGWAMLALGLGGCVLILRRRFF